MVQGGCRLREVGTTNKTHLEDYERAIGPDTALLMRVHTSNYRILGFTEAVSTADLVALGNRRGLPVLEDLGSGSLVDLRRLGLGHEPTVPEVVDAGVDVVTFSGDKLLGGPQAGILVGRRGAIEACAGHPLMRALRPDKVTLAALEATLGLYRDPERVAARVPALSMLALTAAELKPRAEALAEALARELGPAAEVSVREDSSEVGGGALPLQELPTWIVVVRRPPAGVSRWEAALRRQRPPVIVRVHEDSLVLDPRTLRPGEERTVVEAVTAAVKKEAEK
jgi:L-seryl-tRNA(Ser) seleniumtransferase